jgi:5'-methylthioadenosine phosphorylase
VLTVFAKNIERLRGVIVETVEELPTERDCLCSHALDGVETGLRLP